MSRQRRNNVIGVLDIGSSKVVCLIARMIPGKKIEILGFGHNASQGIKGGVLTDLNALIKSISRCVEAAERMAQENIHKVYVSISPCSTVSNIVTSGDLFVAGNEITKKDEKKLLMQVLDKYAEQELDVIHSFPYEYIMDGIEGIENPIGMYANKISCNYHMVSAQGNTLNNMSNCLARAQLDLDGYILSSYASGLACLTPDEMMLGVTLVECGGSSTSISVFHKGHLIFSDGLALGGMTITNDLAQCLCTDLVNAERIKNLYGSVIMTSSDKYEKLEIPISTDDGESSVVTRDLLVEIISARFQEIMELVRCKLQSNGINAISGNKLVLTGGTAHLAGARDTTSLLFGRTVRIGSPTQIPGLPSNMHGPQFTTVVGMILYASEVETFYLNANNDKDSSSGAVGRIINWIKSHFAA